jgi:hypothetical protein
MTSVPGGQVQCNNRQTLDGKAHRFGWRVGEVPARWQERVQGSSRFRVLKWLPAYLRRYFYNFSTTYLGREQKPAKN